MRRTAKIIVVKGPDSGVGGTVRAEFKILILAKSVVRMSDAPSNCNNPFIVGEYLDVSRSIWSWFAIYREIYPA